MRNRRRLFIIATLFALGIMVVTVGLLVWSSGTKLRPTSELTVYYVDSSSGNDKNSGRSVDTSFRTIQKALARAMPGDKIQLAVGSYYENVRTVRSGTEQQRIEIVGSRDAILYGSRGRVFEVNHDYVTLEGFSIDGKAGQGKDQIRDKLIYAIGANPGDGVEGLVVRDMLLENAGGECVRLRYFAKNNEIHDNTIRNCGLYDFVFNEGGKNGEGIYVGTAPEQLNDGRNPTGDRDVSSDNWIHHNQIETHGNECVDIKEASTDNLVEHNTCRYQLDPESAGLDSRGNHNTFRYNTVIGSVGAGVRLGGDGDNDGTHNNVYGNKLEGNKGGPIKILRFPQGEICNNTLIGNSGNSKGIDDRQVQALCD